MASTVGLLGHGRIGRYLEERIAETDGIEVGFVYDGHDAPPADAEAAAGGVDLVVEAADFRELQDLGPAILEYADVLALSTVALADPDAEAALVSAAEAGGTRLYVPHGALLGTDGIQDGRDVLDEVRVETRKHPANLDFSAADVDAENVDGATVLYNGPTRGVCAQFPRNVNSHATVAVAGLGFDDTHSTLIADPASTDAVHHVTATGDGTTLEVRRASDITGVTGEYTLVSIWGTLRRILDDDRPLVVV